MNSKVCYGKTVLKNQDTKDSTINNIIELEYYKIKRRKHHFLKRYTETYGIEIIKKEYQGKRINIEKEEVDIINNKKVSIDFILEKLRDYQVTPIALKDVIEDMIYG